MIAPRSATATGRGAATRGRARSSCRSPSSGRAATSRAFCIRATAQSRRSSRWCSRATVRVSTRRVDQLVESLGLRISKSEVSRIAGLLDEQVTAFRERPLEGRDPYLFVDAKIAKVRDGGRVARKCVVIAHAVHETGRREIIGLDVGEAETEAFWREFLRGLVARGLTGVQLAISDSHPGLKTAIARVLGAPWQRCTVHFLRDLRGHCRKDQHDALGAVIRQLFTAADGAEARRRLTDAIVQLEPRLPKIAALLKD